MTSPGPSETGAPAPFRPPESERVVYRGVTLVDGATGAPRTSMSVATEGQSIVRVAPDAELDGEALAGAEVVELQGCTMTPGLVDSHQHLATPPDRPRAEALLARQVFSGVTLIRDMADDLRQMSDLARATLVGEVPGPDIAYAALMAGHSFFDDPRTWQVSKGSTPGEVPWMQAVDDSTDLQMGAALARGTGAAAIKIYADLPAGLVARITEAGHAQGMEVWAHSAVFPARPRDVVRAGVDVVSHASYLLYDLCPTVPGSFKEHRAQSAAFREATLGIDLRDATSLLGSMAERGTVLDATVSMHVHPEHGVPDEKRAATVSMLCDLLGRAREAGVDIATGTDYERALDEPFPSLYDELTFLAVDLGIPAADVLRSATAVGAESAGLQATTGTVEPGKLANLAVFRENPAENVANLETITLTVKRGRRFPRSEWEGVR